jgi:hypothetical protein
MKSSTLKRKTPLRAKKPLRATRAGLAAGNPLKVRAKAKPRKELAAMSTRRRKELAVLAKAQREAAARSGGRCEASRLPHDCTGIATDFHHVQPRNRRNHVAGNLLHCCRTAHDMIELHPDLAREHGYKVARSAVVT